MASVWTQQWHEQIVVNRTKNYLETKQIRSRYTMPAKVTWCFFMKLLVLVLLLLFVSSTINGKSFDLLLIRSPWAKQIINTKITRIMRKMWKFYGAIEFRTGFVAVLLIFVGIEIFCIKMIESLEHATIRYDLRYTPKAVIRKCSLIIYCIGMLD